MYYHHKNHNILMIIICALRGTTNFTQALNGGHGRTQQTSPLIYLKIQVGGQALQRCLKSEHHSTVGYSTPFFLQLQNQFTNLAILPLPQLGCIFEWSFQPQFGDFQSKAFWTDSIMTLPLKHISEGNVKVIVYVQHVSTFNPFEFIQLSAAKHSNQFFIHSIIFHLVNTKLTRRDKSQGCSNIKPSK